MICFWIFHVFDLHGNSCTWTAIELTYTYVSIGYECNCCAYCRTIIAASMGFTSRDRGTIINFINVITLFKISNDDVNTFAATVVTLVDVSILIRTFPFLFFSMRKKFQLQE